MSSSVFPSEVPDPFYTDRVAFATIPRDWLEEFLVRCSRHGIRVLLDLHAFPGGSSSGTYNGVSSICKTFFFTLFFFCNGFVGCVFLHYGRFVFVSSHFGELPHAKVWPQKPAFWKNKTLIGHTELSQVGLWIVGAAVGWLEHLNDEAKSGLLVFRRPSWNGLSGKLCIFLGGFEARVDFIDF